MACREASPCRAGSARAALTTYSQCFLGRGAPKRCRLDSGSCDPFSVAPEASTAGSVNGRFAVGGRERGPELRPTAPCPWDDRRAVGGGIQRGTARNNIDKSDGTLAEAHV